MGLIDLGQTVTLMTTELVSADIKVGTKTMFFDPEDGVNDDIELIYLEMCVSDDVVAEQVAAARNAKAVSTDIIHACDDEDPQVIYFTVSDQCDNIAIDSLYVDVFENSAPTLEVVEDAVFTYQIPTDNMTCSADSAGLIAAIIAANNMYEGPFEDNIILASDCSFSDGETSYPTLGIDPASLVGLDATCTIDEVQQITLVATNCNGETTTATLDVIITEQAPYPICLLYTSPSPRD